MNRRALLLGATAALIAPVLPPDISNKVSSVGATWHHLDEYLWIDLEIRRTTWAVMYGRLPMQRDAVHL